VIAESARFVSGEGQVTSPPFFPRFRFPCSHLMSHAAELVSCLCPRPMPFLSELWDRTAARAHTAEIPQSSDSG